MNFSTEKFDTLMVQAEEAAAGFDGVGLRAAMLALSAYMDAIFAHPPQDASALEHMRDRMHRYQSLCRFLQQTLHGALQGALGNPGPPCYGPQAASPSKRSYAAPRGACEQHIMPLIRRYC